MTETSTQALIAEVKNFLAIIRMRMTSGRLEGVAAFETLGMIDRLAAELVRLSALPMTDFKFNVGALVHKIKGYKYFGRVVAAFLTLKGEARYVVESTSDGSRGMLFIFNDGQLDYWDPTDG